MLVDREVNYIARIPDYLWLKKAMNRKGEIIDIHVAATSLTNIYGHVQATIHQAYAYSESSEPDLGNIVWVSKSNYFIEMDDKAKELGLHRLCDYNGKAITVWYNPGITKQSGFKIGYHTSSVRYSTVNQTSTGKMHWNHFTIAP